jgi:RelE-like HigB toxin of type II HigAB toxin-antitoxin system
VDRAYGFERPGKKSHGSERVLRVASLEFEKRTGCEPSAASILKDGRAVFNIAGNKFRIVVWINFALSISGLSASTGSMTRSTRKPFEGIRYEHLINQDPA